MYQTGNHISFEHSFPDGKQACSGVVSHIHNDGMGLVVALDKSHKDKKEVLVLARCTDIIVNSEGNAVPDIQRKSDHGVGNHIRFKHEFSDEGSYKNGEIVFVYNDGEGYFVKLDEEFKGQSKEVFFLSNKMVIQPVA